jgi:hypothetical protein
MRETAFMRRPVLHVPPEPDPFEIRGEPRVLRPALRVSTTLRRHRRPLPWLRMILVSSALIAALVYLAQQRRDEDAAPRPGTVPFAALTAPPPVWQSIARPVPLYTLAGGVETKAKDKDGPPALEARQHASGGREDTFVLGRFGDPGHGRLSILRGFAEPEPERFYVALVRWAAAAGLSVLRSAQTQPVATKFGPVQAAEVTLAEAAEQTCVAFRFAHPEVSFGLHGWLCGSEARPVTGTDLACLIDRIALAPGGEDPTLKVVFAQAERQRVCPPAARVATARRG